MSQGSKFLRRPNERAVERLMMSVTEFREREFAGAPPSLDGVRELADAAEALLLDLRPTPVLRHDEGLFYRHLTTEGKRV